MKGERQIAGLWCHEVLEQLYDYIDDELDLEHRSRVEAHLERCSVCATFGGEAGAVARAVRRELAPPDTVSTELRAKLLAIADEAPQD